MGWIDDLKKRATQFNSHAAPVNPDGTIRPGGGWNPFAAGTGNNDSRSSLGMNAQGANEFAGQAQAGYNNLTGQLGQSADDLRAIASGQRSVSAEQLRQALGQNQSQQMSMAAGASPMNQAMAARTAAIQSARLGSGLAGQQAVAGLQERNQAQQALGQLLLGQRGQDVNATLGGYGASNQAYAGTIDPNKDKSWWDKYGGQALGLATGAAGWGAGGAGQPTGSSQTSATPGGFSLGSVPGYDPTRTGY